MGFLSTLFDILATVAETGAKNVDKMTDGELERKTQNTGKSANEMRDMAANTHELIERRKNKDANNDG